MKTNLLLTFPGFLDYEMLYNILLSLLHSKGLMTEDFLTYSNDEIRYITTNDKDAGLINEQLFILDQYIYRVLQKHPNMLFRCSLQAVQKQNNGLDIIVTFEGYNNE